MERFSALLAICEGNSPVPGEYPAQRPVTRNFDVFLICVWINDWVNNREAGNLRRYRAHYDAIVMNEVSDVCATAKGMAKINIFDMLNARFVIKK